MTTRWLAPPGSFPGESTLVESRPWCLRKSLFENYLALGLEGFTIEVGVGVVLDERSRAKVYQFQLKILQIYEDIFIFDVTMDDAGCVTGDNSFDDLDKWFLKYNFIKNGNIPV